MDSKMNTLSFLASDADRFYSLSQFRQPPSFRAFDLSPGLRDPGDMAHVQPFCNPLARKRCLASQSPRKDQLDVRSLGKTIQIRFAQAQRLHRRNYPGFSLLLKLGLGGASNHRGSLCAGLPSAKDIQQSILE